MQINFILGVLFFLSLLVSFIDCLLYFTFQVSAIVLEALLNASTCPDSSFEVAAIVTQPAARRDRGKKLSLSPLASHALQRGFSPDLIFSPLRAGDVCISSTFLYALLILFSHHFFLQDTFLSNLKALQPHLCITAAYGNILPTDFLHIPSFGL